MKNNWKKRGRWKHCQYIRWHRWKMKPSLWFFQVHLEKEYVPMIH